MMTAGALWLNNSFAAFDEAVMLLVHRLYDLCGSFFTPFFRVITATGDKGGTFLILLSLLLLFYKPTRRFGTAMAIGLALGALVTNLWLKPWIARPRPYTYEGSVLQQLWLTMGSLVESDKSFPSGHTTAAFASMTAVFFTGSKRIRWLALVFAFLVGVSRIYFAVHYPSDVLAGILVGFLAGMSAAALAKRIPGPYYQAPTLFLKRKEAA